jgi:hypothetical protein
MPGKRSQRRPRCPFYGFHWPEQGSNLIDTGGSECGLDLDGHGSCQMIAESGRIDFFECPLPLQTRNLLDAGRRYIRFYPAELARTEVGFEIWRDLITR